MLTSRKSIASVLQTAQGPFLVHFRYWLQTKCKQGLSIKVQFGKRPIITIQNYGSGDKYIIFDIVSRSNMPICKFQCLDSTIQIDLKKYQPGLLKQYNLNLGKNKLTFTFQLLLVTQQILNQYQNERITNDQKIRYEQSIQDLIRSQAQFISKFNKDNQVQQLSNLQQTDEFIQQKLTNQLKSIKTVDFNIKTIIGLFIIFFIIGYLISSPAHIKRKIKRKSNKKSKI